MTSAKSQVRVFVALDLPRSVKDLLNEAMLRLEEDLPNVIRWMRPDGIHLTLKFLGDVDAGMVEPLLNAIGRVATLTEHSGFDLELTRLGMFPNAREPRVLWAGVGGDTAALDRLQQSVEETISALGFPPERRPFRPHLTIGRVRDQANAGDRANIGARVSEAALGKCPPWTVGELHLIQSNLTPTGAFYSSLGAAALASSG